MDEVSLNSNPAIDFNNKAGTFFHEKQFSIDKCGK